MPPSEKAVDGLSVCFIVRMFPDMRDAIERHRAWMRCHYKRDRVSLASAARDLFYRGLILSEPERRAKKRRAARRQLSLFDQR